MFDGKIITPFSIARYSIIVVRVLFLFFIIVLSIYLTYHQVFPEKISEHVIKNYPSDMLPHIQFAKEYLAGQRYIPHPLWHIIVNTTSRLLGVSTETSAIIVSSFLIVLWSIIVYYITSISLQNTKYVSLKHEIFVLYVSLLILTVGPMVFPSYSHFIYKGVGSPNIWHNVTFWTVKPFALLAILFTINSLRRNNKYYYILATLFTVFSIFAKPSFVMVFLPAVWTFVAIEKRYLSKKNIYFLMTLTTFSVFSLSIQFINTYGNISSGKIIIDILGVWSAYGGNNVLIAILLALFFPLLFYILYQRNVKDDYIEMSWYMCVFGIILYAMFAESGPHYSHGNFGWSYRIALSMLYLFTIIRFFMDYSLIKPWKRYTLLLALNVQFAIGLYYLYHILIGENPIYIGLYL